MDDAFVQHGAFSWCELMTTDVAAATHCTWPHHGRYNHGTSRGATTSYSKVRVREESVKYSIALGFFGTTGARGVQAQKAVYSSDPSRKNLRTSHPLFTAP